MQFGVVKRRRFCWYEGDPKKKESPLSSQELVVLPPDLVVDAILPYVNVCIMLNVGDVLSYYTQVNGMVSLRTETSLRRKGATSLLFGYFSRDITRSVWMIFRSVYAHVAQDVPIRSLLDALSVQTATIQSLYLNNDGNSSRGPHIRMRRMPHLHELKVGNIPLVIHSESTGICRLLFSGSANDVVACRLLCQLSPLQKLASLDVRIIGPPNKRMVAGYHRRDPIPLTRFIWGGVEVHHDLLWEILSLCRTTLAYFVYRNFSLHRPYHVDQGNEEMRPAEVNFRSIGPFPVLSHCYPYFSDVYSTITNFKKNKSKSWLRRKVASYGPAIFPAWESLQYLNTIVHGSTEQFNAWAYR